MHNTIIIYDVQTLYLTKRDGIPTKEGDHKTVEITRYYFRS